MIILKLLLNIKMIWYARCLWKYWRIRSRKKRKVLIVSDMMTADLISNKKLNPVVTELFIWRRKLNISLAIIMQSYFKVPKEVRLNTTHFFIIKISNKRELQQTVINH